MEKSPPAVADASNVTADEVVDQIAHTKKLWIRKRELKEEVPAEALANAEAESNRVRCTFRNRSTPGCYIKAYLLKHISRCATFILSIYPSIYLLSMYLLPVL